MREPVRTLIDGVIFMAVEPGTKITDERSGRTEVVDDDSVVFKGMVAWATPTNIARLKAEVDRRTAKGGTHD